MKQKKHSTFWLGMQLIKFACRGWVQVPGYTVAEKDQSGEIYIAVQLKRS